MYKATLVSLICNLVLVSIKATALVMLRSLAIATDLGISFVGLAVSMILFYSVKLSNRPADIFHNYGYGKVENVLEALEGVVLIGIATAMSFQAVIHFMDPRHIDMPVIGVFTCVVNSAINFGGAYYIARMAQKSRSPAIQAEAVHYRLEGFISAFIGTAFVGVITLRGTTLEPLSAYLDPAAALFVSIMIIFPSFRLAKGSFFKLLDASVEETSQLEILKQLSRFSERYCEFKDLRTRSSGRHRFIEMKLIMPDELSLREGHESSQTLKKAMLESIPDSEISIIMEPCDKDCGYIRSGRICPYLKL